jgi:hypothetical protein
MHNDDDSYAIDADGNRVLIGLTAAETAEFRILDQAISVHPPLSDTPRETWTRPEDRRWLELYEKHEAARRPFFGSSPTRH